MATLQSPVMVILAQLVCSMSVWVCGPIRVKSDNVTSGLSTLLNIDSYTPPWYTPFFMLQICLETGFKP